METEKINWIIPPGLLQDATDFETFYKSIFTQSKPTPKQPILIRGDRGTGKTLFTNIFKKFYLEDNPEIAKDEKKKVRKINIAALSENLIESELFGHVKGSFTGAITDHKGFLEILKDGLLILEEIGDLPKHIQAKLLNAIEDGIYYCVGDTEPKRTKNVQIVATSNQPDKNFRPDFLDRFIQFPISPVHERRVDILYYLESKFPDVLTLLLPYQVLSILAYNWPGNVREIERVGYLIRKMAMRREAMDVGVGFFSFLQSDTLLEESETFKLMEKLVGAGIDREFLEKELNRRKLGLEWGGKPVFQKLKNTEYQDFKFETDHLGARAYFVEQFQQAYLNFSQFYCRLFWQHPMENKNLLKIEGSDPWETPPDLRESHDRKKVIRLYNQIYDYIMQNRHPELTPEKNITDMTQAEILKNYCESLLKLTNGNIAEAARRAGLNDKTFRSQLKRLGIKR